MKLTKQERETLRNKYGGRCSYCGIELKRTFQADHFIPVLRVKRYIRDESNQIVRDAKNKPLCETIMENPEHDVIENMMPACGNCNNDKGSFTIEGWRAYIPHRLHTLNNNPKYASYQKALRFGLIKETGIKVVFWYERYEAGERDPILPTE